MDSRALRNDAASMLQTVAENLAHHQTEQEQAEESEGRHAMVVIETAAAVYDSARHSPYFSTAQLVSDDRAPRVSVLRLWTTTQFRSLHNYSTNPQRLGHKKAVVGIDRRGPLLRAE